VLGNCLGDGGFCGVERQVVRKYELLLLQCRCGSDGAVYREMKELSHGSESIVAG